LASPEEFPSSIEFHKFIFDPIQLVVPLDHPWAEREIIEPEELLAVNFILREEQSGTYEVASRGLAELGIPIEQLNTILTLGNAEAIALAVEEGLGVGFVSRIVVRRLVNGRVATIRVRDLDMHQEVYIGRNTALPGTTAQNAFWDFVTNPDNPVMHQLVEHGFSHESIDEDPAATKG
jgi:DNA-binding transcriptional LysR family regulator